jgi:YVTN family beta-propeller protein
MSQGSKTAAARLHRLALTGAAAFSGAGPVPKEEQSMDRFIESRAGRGLRASRGVIALRAATLACIGAAAVIASWQPDVIATPVYGLRYAGPTASQPLALSADDATLAVANPDNHSVSLFDVRNDAHVKLAEVPVQSEPNGVAFKPNGRKLYVANTVSGTVSVIRVRPGASGSAAYSVRKHIKVGTEPYGLAITPNGRKLYVTNARSNSVSVIDTRTDTVVKTIANVGFEPRGIAITNSGQRCVYDAAHDGDDAGDRGIAEAVGETLGGLVRDLRGGSAKDSDCDSGERVYVTQFLSLPIEGKIDGADDAKAGHVSVISTATDEVINDVTLNPIADTGFKALGDALQRIAPGNPADPANFKFTTGAYPNQLNNIAIKGDFAFVPNTGASPNGPVRFDVNTQSLLSVLNRTTGTDAGQTINMHVAVAEQPVTPRTFVTLPWAMAFKQSSHEAYVVSAASNLVVKLDVDPATGAAVVQRDSADPDRVLQLATGKNPRGIVIDSKDKRAYVANHVSRDVTVIDLTSAPERVLAASLPSAALPAPGTPEETIHIGKELYNTSIGSFDPAPGSTTPIVGRMSNNGWGSCSACHTPFGLSDNVVWIFPSGPKRTIPQHTDFDKSDPARNHMRLLNWSGERDEEEDFELNIRAVSGGQGLIVLADGVTQDTQVFNLVASPPAVSLPSGDRNQLKVRGIDAWDAIEAYEQFGIRAPISPLAQTDPDVVAGRALFTAANCQQCHGTAQWTTSRVDFAQPAPPPPDVADVVRGQLIAQLRKVGTHDPAFFNEVNQAGAPSLGADGFVPPSLLSLHAFPQVFFHNGAVTSLDAVMDNVTHRAAGTGGVDTLSNAADRAKVIRFLLSIDDKTPPVN